MAENKFESIDDLKIEKEQINEVADLTVKLLEKRYPAPEKKLRGVHPKSHGCLKANFKINKDIPKTLQVGLFDNPGAEYQSWIRFSNAAVRIADDLETDSKGTREHGSRGMAIKVLNIKNDGEFLLEDDGINNQDFLMINTPMFAFANLEDYLRLTQVIHKNNDDPSEFFAPLNPAVPGFTKEQRERTGQSLGILKKIKSIPVSNPLGVQYFSAAPFLFGEDRVMKYSAMPCRGEESQLFPSDITENYLRNALKLRLNKKDDICFDFMVQVPYKNDVDLNIEDATTSWDVEKYPFHKVAKITIHTSEQDFEKQEEECEKMAFNPWHCLAAHKPVGSINRLRKKVYLASENNRP